MRRLLGSSLAVLLAVAAPAGATPRLIRSVRDDGSGLLLVQSKDIGSQWWRCPPRRRCVLLHPPDPQALVVARAPAGTRFRVVRHGRVVAAARWRGRVRAVVPPRATGRLRVGARVRAVAARWRGGWGHELDWLQVQACVSRRPAGCVTLWDSTYPEASYDAVPASAAGRWLVVADRRYGADDGMSAVGSPLGGIPPLERRPAVAVAVAGRISHPG